MAEPSSKRAYPWRDEVRSMGILPMMVLAGTAMPREYAIAF